MISYEIESLQFTSGRFVDNGSGFNFTQIDDAKCRVACTGEPRCGMYFYYESSCLVLFTGYAFSGSFSQPSYNMTFKYINGLKVYQAPPPSGD